MQLEICVFQNDLTGEHSCIMLKTLSDESEADQGAWLAAFWKGESEWKGGRRRRAGGLQTSNSVRLCPTDFRRRFLALLSYQFSTFSPPLALNIIQNRNVGKPAQPGELGRTARRAGSGLVTWKQEADAVVQSGDGVGIGGLVLGLHLPLAASCCQALLRLKGAVTHSAFHLHNKTWGDVILL